MAEIIRMPRMSDTMTEGVIVSWQKKVGDKVKSGDILAEVETDKATMELESYQDGTLLHIGVEEGASVPVDGVLAIIGKEGEDISGLLKESDAKPKAGKQEAAAPQATPTTQTEPAAKSETQPQLAASAEEQRLKASPLAKKMADEKGIDLSRLSGSGDQGRIVRRDVEAYSSQPQAQAPQAAAAQPAAVPSPQGGYEDFNVSQMRKTIARRLSESMYSAPHFYLTVEVNMGESMKLRKRIMEATKEKVSPNDIIIKAAAAALRKHPAVNSSWLGDKIRRYDYVNIGVAIAVEDGLVVPVIRNADSKGMTRIANEVREFAEKARAKKLQPADFEGNTFSISNLGMFGIDEFTAIINPPDACILAVGRIKEAPIVENGELKVGNIMKMTLSCDHRVVDGATGAQFLQTLKQYLEEPVTMLS